MRTQNVRRPRRARTLLVSIVTTALAATALAAVPTARAATWSPPVWKQTIGHPGHAGVYAWGMATAKDGTILVGDYWNYSIRRFSAAGTLLQTIGSKGTGPGQIMGTHGLAVDPRDGAIYHADMNHPWQIQKWAADGTYLSVFSTYVAGKTIPRTRTSRGSWSTARASSTASARTTCPRPSRAWSSSGIPTARSTRRGVCPERARPAGPDPRHRDRSQRRRLSRRHHQEGRPGLHQGRRVPPRLRRRAVRG